MKYVWLFICTLFILETSAQNLVPNPSFEDYNNCPVSEGAINNSPTYSFFQSVKAWVNPLSGSNSSPDYINACAPACAPGSFQICVNMPNASMGFQQARTGNGMVGIIAHSIDNAAVGIVDYAEYIECKLTKPLLAGYSYELTFYVNFTFAEHMKNWNDRNFVVLDRIGAHFSNTIVDNQNDHWLTIPFHVVNPKGNFISDTVNWVKISGVYKAKGGEQFLTIGTFNDGPVTYRQYYPPTPVPYPTQYNYYYIDDVELIEKGKCDTVSYSHDTTSCIAPPYGLQLASSAPAGGQFTWSTGGTSAAIKVDNDGIYWCRATQGCSLYSDTFRVKGPGTYMRDVTDTTVCPGAVDSLKLAVSGMESYRWNTGDTTPSITLKTYGNYRCVSKKGCSYFIDSFYVRQWVPGSYEVTIGDDLNLCNGERVRIGTSYPAKTFLWNTGDTTCCIIPQQSGKYVLTLTDACRTLSDSCMVSFTECYDCMFVPNAFTPNEDGVNDMYGCKAKCPVSDFSLLVYNRWGEQVFATKDIGVTWNGMYKGQPVETGVYYYYIRYVPEVPKPAVQTLRGDITLIR